MTWITGGIGMLRVCTVVNILYPVTIGDAMFIGDVMPSKAENGEKPEK